MIQPTTEDLNKAVQEEEQSAMDYDSLALTFDGMRMYDAANALKHMAHDERRHANNLRAIIEMLQMQGSDSGILSRVGGMLAFVPVPQVQAAAVGMQLAGKVLGADSAGRREMTEWPFKEIPWGELDMMAHNVRRAIWGLEHSRAQHPEGLPLSLDIALRHLKELEGLIEKHRTYMSDSSTILQISWDDLNAMWSTVQQSMNELDQLKREHGEWMRTMERQIDQLEPWERASNPPQDILQTVDSVKQHLDAVLSTLTLLRGY